MTVFGNYCVHAALQLRSTRCAQLTRGSGWRNPSSETLHRECDGRRLTERGRYGWLLSTCPVQGNLKSRASRTVMRRASAHAKDFCEVRALLESPLTHSLSRLDRRSLSWTECLPVPRLAPHVPEANTVRCRVTPFDRWCFREWFIYAALDWRCINRGNVLMSAASVKADRNCSSSDSGSLTLPCPISFRSARRPFRR